jgi:FdrA protein
MEKIVEIPGPLAKVRSEILRAIEDKNHMVVSAKGISLDEEAELKQAAFKRGLLFLGPSCKTAILGGKGFGIWNSVKRGPIGVVSTSGSALREISCLVSGVGVSHVLHVGAKDLSQKIGAMGTRGAINFLSQDTRTEVIVLAAHSPATGVNKRVLDALKEAGKPGVVCFLGQAREKTSKNVVGASNLEDSANLAISTVGGKCTVKLSHQKISKIVEAEREDFGYGQKYVRGIYSGELLCAEAQLTLSDSIKMVHSNVPIMPRLRLPDPRSSRGHACVDMGTPELSGGVDPATDPKSVCGRILQEARDWEVAVILLEVILGNGAHKNPCKELSQAITTAKRAVEVSAGHLSVVASIIGTDRDPQKLSVQRKLLEKAGVVIAPSNAQAAKLAAAIATGKK